MVCAYVTHDSLWIKSLIFNDNKLELYQSMRLPLRKCVVWRVEFLNRHYCARTYNPFLFIGYDTKFYVLHSVTLKIEFDFDLELEKFHSHIVQFEISPD